MGVVNIAKRDGSNLVIISSINNDLFTGVWIKEATD